MRKIAGLFLLALLASAGAGARVHAAEGNVIPQKSDISFTVEKSGETYILNTNGISVDTSQADALTVINGKIVPGGGAVIRDGVSLIPLRRLAAALGLGEAVEWNGAEASLATDSGGLRLTMDAYTALVDGAEVALDAPARVIDGAAYVPARFFAESLGCTIQFRADAFLLPGGSAGGRGAIPALFIEGDNRYAVSPITGAQATDAVRAAVRNLFSQQYRYTKSEADKALFLDQIAFREAPPAMGRFLCVEVHGYDQWAKRFECRAYVDGYTRQIYMGDGEYGITDDISSFFIRKYERHLPMENKPVKVVPFSDISISEDAAFINVNFPEQIGGDALLETYYARASRKAGRVFFSHKNISGETIDYIIRFENESGAETPLRVVEDSIVHHEDVHPYQDDAIREHMARFYGKKTTEAGEDVTLGPGEAYELVVPAIENGRFFTGMADFEALESVTVTVFAAPSRLAEAGEESASQPTPGVPYDFGYSPKTYAPAAQADPGALYYSTYSGTGAGYVVAAEAALRASEMTAAGEAGGPWNIAFETGGSPRNINHRNGLTEIVDIVLTEPRGASGEIAKATMYADIPRTGGEADRFSRDAAENYGNLGNWGVEYIITVRLENDTDADKLFRCHIVPTHQTTWAFMTPDGVPAAVNINNKKYAGTFSRKEGEDYDKIHIGSGIKSGDVAAVTVPAGETGELRYTYVLGTDCESTVYHVWTCVDAR